MYPRLVADIGATNARFALAEGADMLAYRRTVPTRNHDSIVGAIEHYLADLPVEPVAACLAIASPMSGDCVQMTNHHWRFSVSALRSRFAWEALEVVNDSQAIALSLPYLDGSRYQSIGEDRPQPRAPCCVLGPGTGLGVALLVPHEGRWIPVATEGGHASLGPATEREFAVFDYWLSRGLSLSRENFLSGPGIFRLYQALCALNAEPLRADEAPGVHRLATEYDDHTASESLAMFFALLGSACGDQALATGARGGVYLAGGILPRMEKRLMLSDFRRRFEDKPPMTDYMKAITTRLIIGDEPGLTGAAHWPLIASSGNGKYPGPSSTRHDPGQ